MHTFDIIVVGGGHAGIEAAHAAARLGSKTALITLDSEKIGLMPCNPAIGGVGKGHIVFEISALGGLMPKLCTKTYLQARMLNTKKGPAVHGLRLQIDKIKYNQYARDAILSTKNLAVIDGMVVDVLRAPTGELLGVSLENGHTYLAQAVVITTGTFLKGVMHIGKKNYEAGRSDEKAATQLSANLKRLGLKMDRLKTGTPPRLHKDSIDYSVMERQDSDKLNGLFEFEPHTVTKNHPCYITYTNENTHNVIRDNLDKSPLHSGNISGKGPRYCPSLEDKVARFSDKTSHHIFVEPESEFCDDVYPNGISTSMPIEVQEKFIRSIKGFENAVITKPGYAIEYDFVFPNQLKHTLEVKTVPGLFLAGQLNGTTGYEEAAGQGIMAGINAHQKVSKLPEFILTREESYIGVMIDDLVSLSVDEPYRMFTSRAERRLILRQDNVFIRLMDHAYDLGMIDEDEYGPMYYERDRIEKIMKDLRSKHTTAELLIRFGEIKPNIDEIKKLGQEDEPPLSDRAVLIIHADIKYHEYLQREAREVEKAQKYRAMRIPAELDITKIPGLSIELQQKLTQHQPATIAQAMLIPGMTPAAISLLIFRTRDLMDLI